MQKTTHSRNQPIFKKNFFEHEAWATQKLICGIDEVGRGCLAGPLVTAAVILHPGKNSRVLQDSKLMTEPERLKAYAWIMKHSWYGIGIVHNRIIDKHNIWQATLLAMKRSLVSVLAAAPAHPEYILVDAMPLELSDTSYNGIPVRHFYKGESRSCSIAAASIVAKVTRDAMMARLDAVFPGYSLGQHKGYATTLHRNAVRQQSHTIIHRTSFLGFMNTLEKDDHDNQQSLC
jgi:ribonuclease HII